MEVSSKGYAGGVTSLQDVPNILDGLLIRSEIHSATHIIYAYPFDDGSEIHENFDPDGDYGIGFNLLREMKKKTF